MVKRALLKMCADSTFQDNRLPAETELAKMLCASIVTVRRALTVLETEGYIVKRHGIGNFILSSALDPHMRIDLTYDMCSLLETAGFSTVVKRLDQAYLTEGPVDLWTALKVEPGEKMLTFEFSFLADGAVAVLEHFFIPEHLIKTEQPWDLNVKHFDAFVWENCGLELLHSITTWKPQCAEGAIQTQLILPQGRAILAWDQLIYDLHDHPVCGAEAFFHPDLVNMRSLFKWNFAPNGDNN